MGTDYGDITWSRVGIVQRCVLFDGKMQDRLLIVRSCMCVFSNVLTRNGVFFYVEQMSRHGRAIDWDQVWQGKLGQEGNRTKGTRR